jgi:5,10-methylenetetrahydrofolate reductase
MSWNESRRDKSPDTEERREVLPAFVLEASNMVKKIDLNENILITLFKTSFDELKLWEDGC